LGATPSEFGDFVDARGGPRRISDIQTSICFRRGWALERSLNCARISLNRAIATLRVFGSEPRQLTILSTIAPNPAAPFNHRRKKKGIAASVLNKDIENSL
jgi:hypothetical protein